MNGVRCSLEGTVPFRFRFTIHFNEYVAYSATIRIMCGTIRIMCGTIRIICATIRIMCGI